MFMTSTFVLSIAVVSKPVISSTVPTNYTYCPAFTISYTPGFSLLAFVYGLGHFSSKRIALDSG